MEQEKIGLVIEGGGMKCAYSAGILDHFLDAGISFPYVAGVSAGSANAVSFLAGQRDRNRRFYVEYSADPRYASVSNMMKTGEYFGLHYIYGELSNEDGLDPVDYDALMANPAEFCIVATNARTGRPKYFSKEDLERNHFEPIMASSALPVMCKPIEIHGKMYFDGGVRDSLCVEKALEDGCTKLVYLMSKPKGYRMEPQSMRGLYTASLVGKYPLTVYNINHRHERYNRQMEQVLRLEREGKAMIFYVPSHFQIRTTTVDPELMQQLYDAGVADAIAREAELRAFMGTGESEGAGIA
ncbi:MAG: patatin family protein [Lachnospiraceae bacterium]|nr:patatin family protein [Lachnospiraceae bacterium]